MRTDEIRKRCRDAHIRVREIGGLVLSHLHERGRFCHDADGQFYYFDRTLRRLYLVHSESFAAFLHVAFGINPEEHILRPVLVHVANFAEVPSEGSRVAVLSHYSDGVLLVSRFDGSVYRCDGTTISLVPNGTSGVLFLDDRTWQPYELCEQAQTGVFRECLVAPGRFSPGTGCWLDADEASLLYSAWVLSALFRTLIPSRPLLALIGLQGSGKTNTARMLLRWLYGGRADVSALRRDKEDGFIAAVSHSPLLCFDNVDSRIPWLNDHLATLATGGTFPLRCLYTTNDVLQVRPDCYAILTSRRPSFTREDVAERLLVLRTERIAKDD